MIQLCHKSLSVILLIHVQIVNGIYTISTVTRYVKH